MIHLPPRRTFLPSLAFLDFYVTSEYLEEFVARIDLPALSTIQIKLFNDIVFEIPQFCEFIPRLNTPESPTSAKVILYSQFVQVSFSTKRIPALGGTPLKLRAYRLIGNCLSRPRSQANSLLSSPVFTNLQSQQV